MNLRPPASLVRAAMAAALLVGLWAPVSLAQRRPQEFQPPRELSQDELAAAKRSKNSLASFGETMEEKPKPFPWMAVGLGMLALVVAAPFALRTYARTSDEIASTHTFGSRRADDE